MVFYIMFLDYGDRLVTILFDIPFVDDFNLNVNRKPLRWNPGAI